MIIGLYIISMYFTYVVVGLLVCKAIGFKLTLIFFIFFISSIIDQWWPVILLNFKELVLTSILFGQGEGFAH